MSTLQEFSVDDNASSVGITHLTEHPLSGCYIDLLSSDRQLHTTDRPNPAVPDVVLTNDTQHPFSHVVQGRNGRSDTIAAIKATPGETLPELLKRLHPQLSADQLAREIKHVLQYNKAYGNDLGDGNNLAGKDIYLTSIKTFDAQGRVTHIDGPTGCNTDIAYDANGISCYQITDASGKTIEQAEKVPGKSGWQFVSADEAQPQMVPDVQTDRWGDITIVTGSGDKIAHLSRGDKILTKYQDDMPIESQAVRDGQVTTCYQYEMRDGQLRVYALYANHPDQKVLLSDDTSPDAMKTMRCALGNGNDITDSAATQYSGDIPSDEFVENQTARDNAKIVARVAAEFGVDPTLAVATMLVESSGKNRCIGDNGTSFGLFQLHQGGELGNLTPQQAYNPETNARVALHVFAANLGRYSNPGRLAAASQRPADPEGYAAKVNSMLGEARRLLSS